MRAYLVPVVVTTSLILALAAWRGSTDPGAVRDPGHPDGGCSSCGGSSHFLPPPAPGEFDGWIRRYATEPMAEGSEALETLLYHDARSRELLATRGAPQLDADRHAYLARELARERAIVSLRVVDAAGTEHLRVDDATVRIGEKAHLHATGQSDACEFSGTVKRVGVHHLWARF
ncbi:MAG: hypothetical protein AAF628_33750 [Planctomycetota bacterium]